MGASSGHSAAILGCEGLSLSAAERDLFRDHDPLGFILFARNIESPEQVKALTADLRDCVGRADAPILIDQEGGRVARLPTPPWRRVPPAAEFGRLYVVDPDVACEAAWLNGRLLAQELSSLGINVDCVPVLDLQFPGAHEIIGDRSFGEDPQTVAALGRSLCEGLMAGGVLPVIKHIPGHGRATSDSHEALPVVDAPRDALEASDFKPFRDLADMPLGMTAHVVFTAIDGNAPATTSRAVLRDVVRGHMGFGGLLLSDDLSMKALSGGLGDRTRSALEAGCDVALHCNGRLAEMSEVLEACGPMTEAASTRLSRAFERFECKQLTGDEQDRFDTLMQARNGDG